MSDIIDRAQEEELRIRAEALDRARARQPEPGPVFIDGVACCRTCEEPIFSARLRAKPDASRCTTCQAEVE